MNEFERYPELARWVERLAHASIEGMSLSEWCRFTAAIDAALIEAQQNGMGAQST